MIANAHYTYKDGKKVAQNLREHCINTARYAAACLEPSGFYHMAYLAGLLHDMGKATQKFNDYLEEAFAGKDVARGSVNHTFAGVIYLWEKYHGQSAQPMEMLTAEVIAYGMGAHHGLFDCVDLNGKNGFAHRLDKDRKELCYEEAVQYFLEQVATEEEIKDLFGKAMEEFTAFYEKAAAAWKGDKGQKQKVLYEIGMLTRLLLSAVIYGDRRDTAEFMNGISLAGDSVLWSEERVYLEEKLSRLDTNTKVNQVRREISDACLKFAERRPGIYRLSVPTGAGKTLSAFRYALVHGKKYRKKRIIFIIPLLSVLDQNARVIREYVRDERIVLEHHSNVVREKEESSEREELDPYEMLTESWDSPIVISTLVQLLHILFSHKTSAVRRMQALCDSVIIIDEVQSLPKKTMVMFNMALNFLQMHCNATVILSSATQPCLEELDWPVRFGDVPDIVRLDGQQLAVFDRAEIIDRTDPYGMDMPELAAFCREILEEQPSLLVICNTKREARELFEQLNGQAAQDWYLSHLSTAMCQRHRVDVLEQLQDELSALQERLRGHNKCENTGKVVCISTQLVEAGIDFSFSCVVRVLAGIDNLAQAAGRCNRSNEYQSRGRVYLVNLKNENLSMLQEIKQAQESTRHVLLQKVSWQEESLIGAKATRIFYRYLLGETDVKEQIRYPIKDCGSPLFLADLLANQNPYVETEKSQASYLHQPFKTTGMKFEVFDEETYDVIVPYGQGRELIEKLRTESTIAEKSRFGKTVLPLPELWEIMERAKGYMVSIYRWQKEKMWEEGMLHGLFGDRVLVLSGQVYDDQYGIQDSMEIPVEQLIL